MSAHFDDQCYGFWRCDYCGRTLSVHASNVEPQLPPPWREFEVAEFIGKFHVCSDKHEERLRARLRNSKPPPAT